MHTPDRSLDVGQVRIIIFVRWRRQENVLLHRSVHFVDCQLEIPLVVVSCSLAHAHHRTHKAATFLQVDAGSDVFLRANAVSKRALSNSLLTFSTFCFGFIHSRLIAARSLW